MLHWALIFLIIGLIAGAFGFRNVSSTATYISKVLFFLFIVLFIVLLVTSFFQGGVGPVIVVP
ncbi:MAG: DUF1328 domain-containing protein [Legionella sp.]|nr:MAG: DUF1328 domain-containing protein [Legionella sp.]PJD98934.1 MAG: DUF1328 domain-containing protein [Legionella sp.]